METLAYKSEVVLLRFFTLSSIAVASIFPNDVVAQDLCRVALSSNAFNTSDRRLSSRIAMEQRNALCNRDYSSEEEFQSSARSGGFSASYGPYRLGASGGRQSASGRLSFSEEAFCSDTDETFLSTFDSAESTSSGDVALRAWTDCIRITQSTGMWLVYDVEADGTGMVGSLRRTISSGATNLSVTALNVQPRNLADQVECTISGTTFTQSSLLESGPFTASTTSENVSCSKPADVSVRVSFSTDVGSTDWVRLPSAAQRSVTELEELAAQHELLSRRVLRLEQEVAELRVAGSQAAEDLQRYFQETTTVVTSMRDEYVSRAFLDAQPFVRFGATLSIASAIDQSRLISRHDGGGCCGDGHPLSAFTEGTRLGRNGSFLWVLQGR